MRKLAILLIMGWLAMTSGDCIAASALAVDQDDAYSGKVLDKIVKKWVTPGKGKKTGTLKIMISLDDEGKLLGCKVRQSSGNAEVDAALCAAVKEAAPFGSPPYGLPTDLYLAFWGGDTTPATETTKSRKTDLEATPASTTGSSNEKASYIAKISREIRNATYVPKECKPGSYAATAQIKCDAQGKILSSEIIKGSGSPIVDKYVLQGIKRAGSVTRPPQGMGNTFDITIKLTR